MSKDNIVLREDAIEDIRQERFAQHCEWGGDDHDDHHSSSDWIVFISKQLGKAVVHEWSQAERSLFRSSMVKVGALAVAAIEWYDRNWKES